VASARDWRHEEVLEACQGLVLNMNRRVPDEGAVAEAAMALVAGKATVLYKAASGSLIQGSDNPLVLGLGNFVSVSTIPEIAYAFTQLFRARRPGPEAQLPRALPRRLCRTARSPPAVPYGRAPDTGYSRLPCCDGRDSDSGKNRQLNNRRSADPGSTMLTVRGRRSRNAQRIDSVA